MLEVGDLVKFYRRTFSTRAVRSARVRAGLVAENLTDVLYSEADFKRLYDAYKYAFGHVIGLYNINGHIFAAVKFGSRTLPIHRKDLMIVSKNQLLKDKTCLSEE